MSPRDWGFYANEYQEAVDILLKEQSWRKDFIVFPTIFLFRHYIELTLKRLIIDNREFLEPPDKAPQIHNMHDIQKIWAICRELMVQTDKSINPEHSNDKKSVAEATQYYDSLESDLMKFAGMDPNSQYFRYPVDAKGVPLKIDNMQLHELRQELPELVQRITYKLGGLIAGIHQLILDKYEYLAEIERFDLS